MSTQFASESSRVRTGLLFLRFAATLVFVVQPTLLICQEYIRKSIETDGHSRQFGLYVPEAYDGTSEWPLAVSLHGFAWDIEPDRHPLMDGLWDFADEYDFLVVYPQGLDISLPGYPDYPGWNVDGSFGEWNDVAFIRSVIQDIRREFSIDSTRIHTSGYGFGGMMSLVLACEMPEIIAAAASVAAPLPDRYLDECSPDRSVSTLMFFGTDDPFLPYSGNPASRFASSPVEATPEFWAERNGCTVSPLETQIRDNPEEEDFSTASRIEYRDCLDDTEVSFYRIEGGGHTWPGWKAIYATMGWANLDVDATREIFEFFERNPLLIGAVTDTEDEPIVPFPKSPVLHQNHPNPVVGTTTITYELPEPTEVMLTLVDATGRPVRVLDAGPKSTGLHAIALDPSEMVSGIYFYRLEAGSLQAARSMVIVK